MKNPVSFRQLLAIVVFAFGCAANPAAAVDMFAGDLSGTSFAHGQTYAPNTTFSDTFHFDLSAPSGSFSALASQIVMLNFFNIANFSLTLTQPAGPTLSYSPGPDGNIVTPTLTLAQGNDYVVTLSGFVNGVFGGGYGVLLAAVPFVATPVPEPASWAMLLAGLAFFGGVARRRSAG